jgi:putative transposase
MQKTETLQCGKYYHIYNCGINGEVLFREETNYDHFLRLYEKHIDPIAETYAWCLMGNHFHLLVRIKEKKEIDAILNPTGFQNLSGLIEAKPLHQYFSNLFNAYTKAFNKRYSRHGALFERPFKRKLIENEEYLKRVVVYIHNNPVHHGFCNHPVEYGWSSYLTCVSKKPTKTKRKSVLNWFEREDMFELAHNELLKPEDIESLLGI